MRYDVGGRAQVLRGEADAARWVDRFQVDAVAVPTECGVLVLTCTLCSRVIERDDPIGLTELLSLAQGHECQSTGEKP